MVVVAVGTVHRDKHRFTMQRDTIMEKTQWNGQNQGIITKSLIMKQDREINTQLILRDTE